MAITINHDATKAVLESITNIRNKYTNGSLLDMVSSLKATLPSDFSDGGQLTSISEYASHMDSLLDDAIRTIANNATLSTVFESKLIDGIADNVDGSLQSENTAQKWDETKKKMFDEDLFIDIMKKEASTPIIGSAISIISAFAISMFNDKKLSSSSNNIGTTSTNGNIDSATSKWEDTIINPLKEKIMKKAEVDDIGNTKYSKHINKDQFKEKIIGNSKSDDTKYSKIETSENDKYNYTTDQNLSGSERQGKMVFTDEEGNTFIPDKNAEFNKVTDPETGELRNQKNIILDSKDDYDPNSPDNQYIIDEETGRAYKVSTDPYTGEPMIEKYLSKGQKETANGLIIDDLNNYHINGKRFNSETGEYEIVTDDMQDYYENHVIKKISEIK